MRMIVRYTGAGPRPDDEAHAILAASGADRLGDTPRMMLLEGDRERIEGSLTPYPRWTASEETQLRLPAPPGPRLA